MHHDFARRRFHAFLAAVALGLFGAWPQIAQAAEFSVTPIRVELKPGTLSETITVTNHAQARLRVSMKLVEWTQDPTGKDVYKESSDLIYFPRQMELGPDSKRLVRVGLRTPAGSMERAYRLFIEEEPEPNPSGRSQVALYFRFGVPIFLPPAAPRPQLEVMEPVLHLGKLAIRVKNGGNQHVRLEKLTVQNGAGYSQDVNGWYSLAGTERTYFVDIPSDVCRKSSVLSIGVEGPGVRLDRAINVSAAGCA